jgi:hypothetical protein
MIFKHKWLGMALLTSGLCLTASPVTINFDGANSAGGADFGNSKTFTCANASNSATCTSTFGAGFTITATAWGVTGNSNTTFQTGQISEFLGDGLGACNQDEGIGPSPTFNFCNPPNHQVTNNNGQDFILLQVTSGQTFTLSGLNTLITLITAGNLTSAADTDVTYYLRNGSGSFAGSTLAGLVGGTPGFGAAQTDNCPAANDAAHSGSVCVSDAMTGSRTFALSPAGTYNAILIGAKTGDTNDFLKIKSLTIDAAAVPEPATISLLGGALLGLGVLKLRRKNRV